MRFKGLRNLIAKPSNKFIEKSASNVISSISKNDFLEALGDKWYPLIKRTANVEEEITKAKKRMENSGPFKKAFESLNITDDDLRFLIEAIIEAKPEEIEKEPEPGRNAPCSCGSGKKYKKCCLKEGKT
jgi:uncharacterized protein YecA (UPF0149 family)